MSEERQRARGVRPTTPDETEDDNIDHEEYDTESSTAKTKNMAIVNFNENANMSYAKRCLTTLMTITTADTRL